MIAASSALLGIGILRYAWRRPARLHALMVSGGWATVIVSMILYARACGAEAGVPFALAAFSLGGIAAVLGNIEIRTPKKREARERSTPPAESHSSALTVVLRTIVVGLLTALAAWGVGLAYARSFTLPGTNVLLFSGFALLVIWSALIVWASSDPRVVRITVILAALTALANGVAYGLLHGT